MHARCIQHIQHQSPLLQPSVLFSFHVLNKAWWYSFPNMPAWHYTALARPGTARLGTARLMNRAVPCRAAVPDSRPRHGTIIPEVCRADSKLSLLVLAQALNWQNPSMNSAQQFKEI